MQLTLSLTKSVPRRFAFYRDIEQSEVAQVIRKFDAHAKRPEAACRALDTANDPKANDALTFKLDHSSGAAQLRGPQRDW